MYSRTSIRRYSPIVSTKIRPLSRYAGDGADGKNLRVWRAFRLTTLPWRNYDWGMIAMAVQHDWISVEKAAGIAGCSEQYIRRDLDKHLPRDENGIPTSDRTVGGRLEGWRVHGKAWLVSRSSALAIRGTLSTRARVHEAKRASKKLVKKKASRRKK